MITAIFSLNSHCLAAPLQFWWGLANAQIHKRCHTDCMLHKKTLFQLHLRNMETYTHSHAQARILQIIKKRCNKQMESKNLSPRKNCTGELKSEFHFSDEDVKEEKG